MTSADIHTSLLRPAVLQVLRAAGFNHARPAVVDTVTDLAARYLLLIASSTAQNAFITHNSFVPTIQDVRLALSEAGALFPQLPAAEESLRPLEELGSGEMAPFEDLRGVNGFVAWAQGEVNKGIRRVAGYGGDEMNVEQIAAGTDEKEDYLIAMKKNGREAEDSRYHGTILGGHGHDTAAAGAAPEESDLQPVQILGGPVTSISDWVNQFQPRAKTTSPVSEMEVEGAEEGATPASSGLTSAPATPAGVDVEVEGISTPLTEAVKDIGARKLKLKTIRQYHYSDDIITTSYHLNVQATPRNICRVCTSKEHSEPDVPELQTKLQSEYAQLWPAYMAEISGSSGGGEASR